MTDKPGIGDEWLTTEQAAQLTGYSQAYMRQLAERGRVPAHKVGRDWVLQREALLAFARGMAALGPAKHNPWKEDRDDLAAQERGR